MNRRPRILFVSHSASRNGATLLLLHLLQWLQHSTDYHIEVLICDNGELTEEFQSLCKTKVLLRPDIFVKALPRRWRTVWGEHLSEQYLKWRLKGRHYDLVYFNTSAVASYVPILSGKASAVLWHIHELEYVLRLSIGEQSINNVFPCATRFISVSQAVSDVLTKQFSVPVDKLDLVHGFASVSSITREEIRSRRQRIRQELGWSEGTFVIGGCGSLGWRKGTDIFLQVARELCRNRKDTVSHFLWVGGGGTGDEALRFAYDVAAFGLSDRCHLAPTTSAVMDYYYAMDAFALTSREDPFPLVMLEAGLAQLPIICFAGTGGGPEFVGDDAGFIAPYLDIATFATHLETLRDNPQLCSQYGAQAETKVKRGHVVETQGPKLLASIQRCLATASSAN